MSRRFELLKDWGLSVKGGNFLEWYEDGQCYRVVGDWMKTFPKEIVENMSTYFKEIKPTEQSSKPFEQVDDFVFNFLAMETFDDLEQTPFIQVYDKLKKYKELRTIHRIPAGKGTAIDVLNTEAPQKEEGKDWEIVEFAYDNGRKSKSINLFNKAVDKIISVKRLSDSEVFSVGDEVEYRNADAKDWKGNLYDGKIHEMRVSAQTLNKLVVEINDNHRRQSTGFPHKYIENIRHKSKPQPQQESKRQRRFNEKELLDAEQKAFLSARCGIWSSALEGAQFKTFSDYKNTQQ